MKTNDPNEHGLTTFWCGNNTTRYALCMIRKYNALSVIGTFLTAHNSTHCKLYIYTPTAILQTNRRWPNSTNFVVITTVNGGLQTSAINLNSAYQSRVTVECLSMRQLIVQCGQIVFVCICISVTRIYTYKTKKYYEM